MPASAGTILEDTKHTHCSQAHINQDVILCQSGQVFQLRVSILIQQRGNYFLGQTRNVRSRLQKESIEVVATQEPAEVSLVQCLLLPW